MRPAAQYLGPAEAARRLGVSPKALRLYEQRGMITPLRTAAGWRAYGPEQMRRAEGIVALRRLGLSLAQIGDVTRNDERGLATLLARHQAALEMRFSELAATHDSVRSFMAELAQRDAIVDTPPHHAGTAAFDLPWPWGGERFELGTVRPLNYIIGPLGSGKTRLARAIAQNLAGAVFLGPERLADDAGAARSLLDSDLALAAKVDRAMAHLVAGGASVSMPLLALLAGLESEGRDALVVDMVEDGLDKASQTALMAWLRRRGTEVRPLFLMTRSAAILDLSLVGGDETILFCPANHSPPIRVAPYPGAPGYEAVATCLASPEVRARTAGVVAWRPQAA